MTVIPYTNICLNIAHVCDM